MIKKQFIAYNVCLIFSISPVLLFAKSGKTKDSKVISAKDSKNQEGSENSEPKFNLDNPYINPDYILSQKVVWLELHLEERINTPFFTNGREISRHIINAVLNGKVTPYKDEECTTIMTIDEFLKNLRDPRLSLVDEDSEFLVTHSAGSNNKANDHSDVVPTEEERFRPKEVSTIGFKCGVTTNSITSTTRIIVYSVALIIPGKRFLDGIRRVVAYFKFEGLQNHFDTLSPDDCWMNPRDETGNMTFSNALRQPALWYTQSYLVCTESMKRYGQEPDPSKPLDFKKSDIITEEAHLWVY